MQQQTKNIIVRQDDYETLIAYFNSGSSSNFSDAQNISNLKAELKRAKLVSKDEFPDDVVRLNSRVKIKDSFKNNIIELVLVMPDEADIKQKKVSVIAPVGTALIGFRKGEKINWQVPAGKKTLDILEVNNRET